jgi:hypothetical protein
MAKPKVDDLSRRLASLKKKRADANEALVRAETEAKVAKERKTKIENEIKERWDKTPAELAKWAKKEAAELDEKIAEMEAKVES